jgi:GT2 family glycosyltransferase
VAQSLVSERSAGHAYVAAAKGCRIVTRVAVSMLNFNSSQSTIACIQSLLLAEKATVGKCQLEIYLSDNASVEEDQHQLKTFLRETETVHFQVNVENLGFSAGHNRNLERIFADSNPDYIWLLNNDCLVAETALGALVECANQNPDVGIWGATLLESDGKTIQCAGGCFYNTWISSYRQFGQGGSIEQINQLNPLKFDYISGASLFFPVETLNTGLRPLEEKEAQTLNKRQQWLNEHFFLYFEELDLAKRLKSGLEMAWCKDARISHIAGVSTGTSENQRSALAEYHSTLSALIFTREHYPLRLLVMAPLRYFSKALLLLLRGDFKLIGIMTKAYWDFLIG